MLIFASWASLITTDKLHTDDYRRLRAVLHLLRLVIALVRGTDLRGNLA